MQIQSTDRSIPFTTNRALTELVHGRQQVDAARRSLGLALEIFRRVDPDRPTVPLSALEQVLGQLEEAEASLWEASQ